MDRGDARPHACRRLFADLVDADMPMEDVNGAGGDPVALEQLAQARRDNDSNRLWEQLFQQERAAARQKWNFDFETETPLEGDWEWERVAAVPGGAGPAQQQQQQQQQDQQQGCGGRVQVQQEADTRDPDNKSL